MEKRLLPSAECCDMDTYECHQAPLIIKGNVRYIDVCIIDIVKALNMFGIATISSCCGRGKINGSIVLEDGRELTIKKFKPRKEVKP